MSAPATPGQTVGPFFHYGMCYPGDSDLVSPASSGAVALHGRVFDGRGGALPDALLEIWQACPDGSMPQQEGSIRRDGWSFTGFGRAATDAAGRYVFSTLVPGPTAPGRPAFFAVTVFARGLLNRLITRAYLPDDEAALAADPLLAALPEARRATLIARRDRLGLEFDIRLQGPQETVFLQFPGQ